MQGWEGVESLPVYECVSVRVKVRVIESEGDTATSVFRKEEEESTSRESRTSAPRCAIVCTGVRGITSARLREHTISIHIPVTKV